MVALLLSILFLYVSVVSAYWLIASALGRRRLRTAPVPTSEDGLPRFAVLLPAYREDAVIVNTVNRALRQQYPRSRFDVVVIAPAFFFLIRAPFEAEVAGVVAVVQIISGLFFHADVRVR